MNQKSTKKFITREFPNNASGQKKKLVLIQNLEAQGWEVEEERIQTGQFSGGKACCLFILCAPLAFFAYRNGTIVVSFSKEK